MVTVGSDLSKIRYSHQPLVLDLPFIAPHPRSIGPRSAPLPRPPPPPQPPTSPPSSPRRNDSELHLWPRGPEARRMNQQPLNKQDFEPSPPTCNGLEPYIEIPAISDMRYNQEPSNITSISLETPSQPPSVLSNFPAPLLNNSTGYSPDTGHYYPPTTSQLFSAAAVDPRSRLGSTTSSTGMAHTPRNTTLPVPAYSTRDIYAGPRPSFMRTTDHLASSPSFAAPLRRHPLSPTPSPNIGFTTPVRMESVHHQYAKGQVGTVPPLLPPVHHGQLVYGDAGTAAGGTPVKIDIQGHIDKGFFLSDGEWTCYRRNYFSCVCSYSLTPYYANAALQYIPNGTASPYTVLGFAMCISAVVSESDSQSIDLVQHTPKRDKGPTTKPEKVRLMPKPAQQTPHPLGLYPDPHAMASGARSMYEGYGPGGQGSYSTEHTFERIQFKQATANNGKRRAAQQYYHLVVELYADVGSQNQGDQFIKVAERKSAKMIVRGRSPGHYQKERRGSTSSGPGGSGGMPGGYPNTQVMNNDFGGAQSSLLSGGYSGTYGTRSTHFEPTRHPDLGLEPMIPSEDAQAIETTKEYRYYPSTIYENVEPGQRIEMYSHRNDPDTMMTGTSSAVDSAISKVKNEYEHTLPSIVYQSGPAYHPRSCSRFGGRPTSEGYYPAALSQSG